MILLSFTVINSAFRITIIFQLKKKNKNKLVCFLVTPWYVGSYFPNRGLNLGVPVSGVWGLNHCTTREGLGVIYFLFEKIVSLLQF